ncbi:MAG: hypothetical protein U1F52_06095 [Burkholderiales bacterium]
MRGPRLRTALRATAIAALCLGGCSSAPDKPKVHEGSGKAFIPRSILEITPCITDALRTTFGVSPETDHSYARPQGAGPEHYKLKYIVRPNAAATGIAEDSGQRLTYEIYNRGRVGTGVLYTVEVTRGSVSEWLAQAAIPLEQCGATIAKR